MTQLMALVAGIIFGLGLAISQMTNPRKVLDFLDITGNWDASLLFVLGGAVSVTLIGFYFILRWQKPICANSFSLPQKKSIDRRLVIGSALFGVGWGVAGYCPGPGISALAIGYLDPVYFILAMLVGSLLGKWLIPKL